MTRSVIFYLLIISVDQGIVSLCLVTCLRHNILPDPANCMRTADMSWCECTLTLSLDVSSILITHQKRCCCLFFSNWAFFRLAFTLVCEPMLVFRHPSTHPYTHCFPVSFNLAYWERRYSSVPGIIYRLRP